MKPKKISLTRLLIGSLAVYVALLSLYSTIGPLVLISEGPAPPINVTTIAGYTVVQSHSEDARFAGVEVGDRVLMVDGIPAEHWFRNSRNSMLIPGIPNSYFIEKRDASQITLGLFPDDISWRGLLASKLRDTASVFTGCVYLAIGLFVWFMQRDRREAWAFLLFCSMLAMQFFVVRETSMGWSYLRASLSTPLVSASIFYFFSLFPSEPAWLRRYPGVRSAIWGSALFISALVLFEVRLGIPIGTVSEVSFDFSCLVCSGSVAMLLVERREVRDARTIDLIDVILLSTVVGFLPLLLALLAQIVLRTSFPLPYTLLWLLVFPVAVGYAILRRQNLLEISAEARSQATYGFISVSVTLLVALLVTFANASVSGFDFGTRAYWYSVGYLFLAIIIFNPVRARLQSFVDRVFDRDRARYHRAVGEVADAMVSMLSIREIVQRILIVVTDTMGVRRAMVLMLDEEKQSLIEAAARGDWDEGEELVSIPSDHVIEKYLWVRREPVSNADFENETDEEVKAQCRELFEHLEIQLLVPILFGAELLGVIAVGEKLSKDRFDRHDRALLGTLANQSAIAIENAKVFDELGTLNETLEARVEERTEELKAAQSQLIHNEKMVGLGQLVAGVAHELNNPIGFVHANLQLIDERIQRLTQSDPNSPQAERAREALTKLLSRSREGTERVKKIVEDLRTFSRLDHAELSEVDLNHCVESTVSLMRPRLRDGVVVEKHYGDLPPVRCYSGQLNQVFMNLLVNACDAIDGEGVIRIETEQTEEGVRLRFSDSGPGIPEEIRSRIFEPFFTTKEVGKGTGLGLSISHGIIERHGGKISIESMEGGSGVAFVIELPLDVAAQEEPVYVEP